MPHVHCVDGIPREGLYVDQNGTKQWFKNGLKHRVDGPAVEWLDGEMHWYFEGMVHRDDGPAVILKDGTSHWYRHGQLHREDGPAATSPRGTVEFWYRGVYCHSLREYSNVAGWTDKQLADYILKHG